MSTWFLDSELSTSYKYFCTLMGLIHYSYLRVLSPSVVQFGLHIVYNIFHLQMVLVDFYQNTQIVFQQSFTRALFNNKVSNNYILCI